jgi:hypothetical protein
MYGRCRDCVFFRRVNVKHADGACHRYAPKPGDGRISAWPSVLADDGCGDFDAMLADMPNAGTDPVLDAKVTL